MSTDRNRLEFERIRNLTQGFGWVSAREEITETELVLVLRKSRVEMPLPGQGMPSS